MSIPVRPTAVRTWLVLSAHVVLLDLATPFTAARARNAGLDSLLTIVPGIDYVQFVDGDCEIDAAWLAIAERFLDDQPSVVVVCGRRRERFPQASRYNRLCDLEWDTPVGEASACGGDAMMRVAAIKAVGGYRIDLIAGEEPELCVRLRAQGSRIVRLDAEMTRHDAAMTRFGQWWARNVRAGYAFAEVSRLHAQSATGIWKREARSNWLWGLILPIVAIGLAPFTWGVSLALLSRLHRPVLANPQRPNPAGRRCPNGSSLCLVLRTFEISPGDRAGALLAESSFRPAESTH